MVRALRDKSQSVRRIMLGHGPNRLHESDARPTCLCTNSITPYGSTRIGSSSIVGRTIYSREFRIFVMLLGRALGYLEDDEDGDNGYCTGIGLARIVVENPDEVGQALRLLQPDGTLIKRELIQPSDGMTELLSTNPRDLGNGI